MDRKADSAIQSLTEVVSPRMSNMTRRCQDRVHGDALKSLEKLTLRADCGSHSRMKPIIIFEQKNKATYWIYQHNADGGLNWRHMSIVGASTLGDFP